MRRAALLLFLITCLPLILLQTIIAQRIQPTAHANSNTIAVPAPNEVLGFTPGDDRKLASWNQIVDYFVKLDQASERVKFEALGNTTMGKPFVMATISAPENLANLQGYKAAQAMLADPRRIDRLFMGLNKRYGREPVNVPDIGPIGMDDVGRSPKQFADKLIRKSKTIVLITCGIHSDEVGSTLSSTLIAHRLASSNDPEIQQILKNTIILLVPSLNPDGVDIVKNWYDKTLGTPYEGTEPPELYHKYVGHDNNRDWYAFTQVETQITVDKIHNVWHPQIVHDIHQQGAFGSRLFLPPYMPPVEPNVPKQLVQSYTELGNWMAGEMRKAGFAGITTGTTYDAWTPARAYSHYHGGVRMLSETASARIATPITVKFEELRTLEGYNPQKESDKFGPVWKGGEWRLRDITNYMTTAAFALLRHASQNRERWLRGFYEIGTEAVRPRRPGELFGFLIKPGNRSQLVDTLHRANVEIDFAPDGRFSIHKGPSYPQTTLFVRMDQPYGSFAKALLERQHYPNLRNSEGQPIPPYDVTAHTLSMLMGVEVVPVWAPFVYKRLKLLPAVKHSNCCDPAPQPSRIGLYRSYVPSMDEGWTRWILERNGFVETHSLFDQEIRLGKKQLNHPTIDSTARLSYFSAIIIPDQAPRAILNGHRAGAMPDEYTGGLGPEGVTALREFVEQGGTLIFLNRASDFAIEQFKLPLRNVVAGLPRSDFYVPGSILRIELDNSHPIAEGVPKESIAWVEDSPAFEVSDSGKEQVRVIAWYPKDKDPLLSGWLLGGERLKGNAALVEVTLGKGRIVLFGFRPQYRAQSLATYPLLFNAIRQK